MHEVLVRWVSYVVPVIELVGITIVLWVFFKGSSDSHAVPGWR